MTEIKIKLTWKDWEYLPGTPDRLKKFPPPRIVDIAQDFLDQTGSNLVEYSTHDRNYRNYYSYGYSPFGRCVIPFLEPSQSEVTLVFE